MYYYVLLLLRVLDCFTSSAIHFHYILKVLLIILNFKSFSNYYIHSLLIILF